MKIVMKTLFETIYQRRKFQLKLPQNNQNYENTGPVSRTEEGVVSLYDLSSHKALKKQVTISDTNVYLDV